VAGIWAPNLERTDKALSDESIKRAPSQHCGLQRSREASKVSSVSRVDVPHHPRGDVHDNGGAVSGGKDCLTSRVLEACQTVVHRAPEERLADRERHDRSDTCGPQDPGGRPGGTHTESCSGQQDVIIARDAHLARHGAHCGDGELIL